MKLRFSCTLLLLISGCVSGPKRENDSPAAYLNGNNYHESANVLGVPVIERQRTSTKITGTLVIDAKPLPEPLKFQTLILSKEKKEILRTRSDSQGVFTFSGDIPDGSYTLAIVSDHYRAERALEISATTTEAVQIMAETFKGP